MPGDQIFWQLSWWFYFLFPQVSKLLSRAADLTVKSGYSTSYFALFVVLGRILIARRKEVFP